MKNERINETSWCVSRNSCIEELECEAQEITLGAENISLRDVITIPANRAIIGTNAPLISVDYEGPMRREKIILFQIDRTTVTNRKFAKFIDETGYQTDAERIGWSFVFHHQLPNDFPATQAVANTPWWRVVQGASWTKLIGADDTLEQYGEHPVVHVSKNDAEAFAKWAGGRLPTEVEWEHAARGGLGDVRYPWGDHEPNDDDFTPCNIWQGEFPKINTSKDGFSATAPADSFDGNGYNLKNIVGNVWEWVNDPFINQTMRRSMKLKELADLKEMALLKGGSFLCHKSYCHRYRIAARSANTADSTSTHMGFRLVYDCV